VIILFKERKLFIKLNFFLLRAVPDTADAHTVLVRISTRIRNRNRTNLGINQSSNVVSVPEQSHRPNISRYYPPNKALNNGKQKYESAFSVSSKPTLKMFQVLNQGFKISEHCPFIDIQGNTSLSSERRNNTQYQGAKMIGSAKKQI
jgi:hypothetical protein